MAQLPGDARVNQYIASAGQTTFTYDFQIYADDEITVQQGSTTLTLTTHYTVTDAGEEAGGTIVLVTGATLNDVITLTGNTMVEVDNTFVNGGDFAASAINENYEKLINLVSENVTDLTKTMRLKVYDPAFDASVPSPTAGKALKINPTGDGFVMSTHDPDDQSDEAAASAAAAAASAADSLLYSQDSLSYSNDADGDAVAAADSAAEAAASAASINLPACASNIYPATTNTYSLGSVSKRWSYLHATSIAGWGTCGIAGTLSCEGNFAVATNKFTVASATGNTVIAGTLTVGGTLIGTTKAAQYTYIVADDVAGGAYNTGNTWQIRPINTEVFDTIGASLASNRITLPAGTYTVNASATCYSTDHTYLRLYDYTNSTALTYGSQADCVAEQSVQLNGAFTIAGAAAVELDMIGVNSNGSGMGVAAGDAVLPHNVYANILFTKIA